MDIVKIITEELNIKSWQTEAVIKLIDEGNTIPFISRYRKEATGGLNDEVLRKFDERLTYLRKLDERKQTIINSIEEQGKLTDDLKNQIDNVLTSTELEDIYRPFKPKRRTRAMIAKEKGLEPLALFIMMGGNGKDVYLEASKYVNEENGVVDCASALQYAEDIIAEQISDNADYRSWIRNITYRKGLLTSEGKDLETDSTYSNYYSFSQPIRTVPGHRILAINRGEKEKVLKVKVVAPADEIIAFLNKKMFAEKSADTCPHINNAVNDAYKRLISPSIETEIRNELTDAAQENAIKVFKSNLKQLLMQSPVKGKNVLGWDPAFRTGCKLAVVDNTGKVLNTDVIFPTPPQNKVEASKETLKHLISKYHIDIISVGNGTASRESEAIISDFINENQLSIKYAIVNEAGASVYSASKLATEEFPEFDVGQRSAASIARRLQDPLAELVKIDPKSIGVGQYQHDMNQARLDEALKGVVEDCVNSVGIDLNTASYALLSYVSGINKTIAKNIVEYREKEGSFSSRKQLLKVPKLGPKAYEQCAGFLRIPDGKEPLDRTGVHPESYTAAEKLLASLNLSKEDIITGNTSNIRSLVKKAGEQDIAAAIGLGEFTMKDIINELEKPGRDIRDGIDEPILRSDVVNLSDLKPDMVLKGTVRNITDFGAFVDIGVHQDGLVHISQMSDKYIKHPLDVVKVGDVVDVKVISIDENKNRIALSMKNLK